MANVNDVVAKWSRNGKASVQSYIAGVQSVTESPTAAAARNIDKYQAGVQEAIESGKLQRGLQRVTKENWIAATVNVGAQRLASGFTKGEQKFQGFMTEFLPFVQGVQQQVKAMPSATPEERDQRMLRAAQLMRQFRRRSA